MDDIERLLPSDLLPVYQRANAEISGHLRSGARGAAPDAAKVPDFRPFRDRAQRAEKTCARLLGILDPAAAIGDWMGAEGPLVEALQLSESGVIECALWTLGAGASGTSRDLSVLVSYLRHFGFWWSCECAAERFTRHSDDSIDDSDHQMVGLAISVALTPNNEFLWRTSSQLIRFRWSSRMIVEALCREIERDTALRGALPDFNMNAATACFAGIDRFGRDLCLTPSTSEEARLAQHMAMDSGSLAGRGLRAIATSSQRQARPWLRFGTGVAPLALKSATLHLEVAVLEAIDCLLLSSSECTGATKGELFELAAQSCIEQALHRGSPPLVRPLSITVVEGGKKKSPDVDIALVSRGLRRVSLIGEAKAKQVPTDPRTIPFEEQVKQVVTQLSRALQGIDDGVPLRDANRVEFYGDSDTVGIGVMLHGYSSNLYDPYMLTLLPQSVLDPRIAISDLQSWVIIMSSFGSLRELRDYLEFRYALLSLRVSIQDESDLAIAFLRPDREKFLAQCRSHRIEAQSSGKPAYLALPANSISALQAILTERPTNATSWRRDFFGMAQNLPIVD